MIESLYQDMPASLQALPGTMSPGTSPGRLGRLSTAQVTAARAALSGYWRQALLTGATGNPFPYLQELSCFPATLSLNSNE